MSNIFDLFKKIEKKEDATPVTHIVVGLGNPGTEYAKTRHNAGFLMMDYLAERAGIRVDRSKFKALVGDGEIAGKRVLLMKPQTFMNLSGEAVAEAAKFYKIAPENILVLSDDISLDVGRMRLRQKGSDGGQNGLKNIILHLSSDAFPRLRFGVGKKPHPDYDLAAWVLSEFTKDEQKLIFDCFSVAYDGVTQYLSGKTEAAVQTCNGKR